MKAKDDGTMDLGIGDRKEMRERRLGIGG